MPAAIASTGYADGYPSPFVAHHPIINPPGLPKSLAGRLHARAQQTPDKPSFTWFDDQGKQETSLTFRQLNVAVTAIADYLLQEEGIRAGDRVLLVFPPGVDFWLTFLGCLRESLMNLRHGQLTL